MGDNRPVDRLCLKGYGAQLHDRQSFPFLFPFSDIVVEF